MDIKWNWVAVVVWVVFAVGASGEELRERLEELAGLNREMPEDAGVAAELVDVCLRLGKETGKDGFLGVGWMALGAWEGKVEGVPGEVLLARGLMAQRVHEFDEALVALERLGEVEPENARGWLVRSTVLVVLGRYDEARKAAMRFKGLSPTLMGTAAVAAVDGVTGRAAEAVVALERGLLLARRRRASAGEMSWALGLLAETLERLGRDEEAERRFKEALVVAPDDGYLLGAYADFLIGEGRGDEVEALLAGNEGREGLLLRLLVADPDGEKSEERRATLEKALSGKKGGVGGHRHLREEAIFALDVKGDVEDGLELAVANWEAGQREPEDAEVVLRAALKAGKPESAAGVVAFLEKWGTQSVVLKGLVDRLQK